MKTVKVVTVVILLLLSGCATVDLTSSKPYKSWDKGEGRRLFKVSFVNTNAFAPSTSNVVVYECRDVINGEGMTDTELFAASPCRPMLNNNHDSGAGAFTVFGSAVVNAAGMITSAALIGEGLGKSGSVINNENENEVESEVTGIDDDRVYPTAIFPNVKSLGGSTK